MARRTSRTTSHPDQPGFFDIMQMDLNGFGMRLRETLADTLALTKERKGMDRHAIAAELGRLDPDRDVSKHMLDRFCAPSSMEWRLPAELVPALYRVTGDDRIMRLIAEGCDHKIIPNKAAAIGELMLVNLEKKRLAEREDQIKRALSAADIEWAATEMKRRAVE